MKHEASVTKAGSIALRSGRELALSGLAQELTYEGLLEGVPTTKINRLHVDNLVEKHRARSWNGAVHLVTPVETPLPAGGLQSMGSPAVLPRVTCIGRFRSGPIAESPGCYSELTIIWFQSEFALPIEATVLDAITRLDWNATAVDFSDW
jgi:hypothetical protein